MTVKLFAALYAGLIAGMIVLFIANFPLGWVFFGFLFVAVFGGMLVADRPYLIAAGFLVTSLIVMGVGLLAMLQAWQTDTWPTAPGVITRSWYCTRTTSGLEVYRGPCIEYRYRVGNQTFEVGTIETSEYARGGPLALPDTFQAGQEVKVHYDPRNPGISRLAAVVPPRDWITTLVGAIMAGLSAFTLLWVLLKPEGKPKGAAVNLSGGQTAHPGPHAGPRRGSPDRATPDLAAQLEKLAELHEQQAISDAEYELAKKRLLG